MYCLLTKFCSNQSWGRHKIGSCVKCMTKHKRKWTRNWIWHDSTSIEVKFDRMPIHVQFSGFELYGFFILFYFILYIRSPSDQPIDILGDPWRILLETPQGTQLLQSKVRGDFQPLGCLLRCGPHLVEFQLAVCKLNTNYTKLGSVKYINDIYANHRRPRSHPLCTGVNFYCDRGSRKNTPADASERSMHRKHRLHSGGAPQSPSLDDWLGAQIWQPRSVFQYPSKYLGIGYEWF